MAINQLREFSFLVINHSLFNLVLKKMGMIENIPEGVIPIKTVPDMRMILTC